jgi:hypothetical protein
MAGVRATFVVLLVLEALNALLWAARIASAAAVYDTVVLVMVLLRVLVSALQGVSAWLLANRALPAVALARLAFGLSAALLVFEIGFRLSPSSVQPDLRFPIVAAYVAYALTCIRGLGYLARAEQTS